MTEQEYINVRDLSSVIYAERILRDIVPANQPLIAEVELRGVMEKLNGWKDALFSASKCSHTERPDLASPGSTETKTSATA